MSREDGKPKKWNALCAGTRLRPVFVQCEAKHRKPLDDLTSPFEQLAFVVREQQEIIHVTEVAFALKFTFDKVIERAEITVCPELTGEIANGQAARALDAEEVVAAKINHLVFLRQYPDPALQNLLDEPQDVIATREAGKQSRVARGDCFAKNARNDMTQYFMVNARKELADIAGQDVTKTARELCGAVECFVSALADAVGIRIDDERSLEDGFDDIAQRVVNDAVAERRGGNQAILGIMDVKTVILARLVGFILQFTLKLQQVVFQSVFERGDVRVTALAFAGFAIGEQEVFPGAELLEHGVVKI